MSSCAPIPFKTGNEVITPKGCTQGRERGLVCFNEVFKGVKGNFTSATDMDTFGKADYWATPSELDKLAIDKKYHGDCDDFAILIRDKLDKLGIENRLVLCVTETGEFHLVTESGGYIFDVRQEEVLMKQELNYTWISISGFKVGETWHEIINS